MSKLYEKVRTLLKKCGQEHLLSRYDEMTAENQFKLLDMISSIDFNLIEKLYQKAKQPPVIGLERITPCRLLEKKALKSHQREAFRIIGEETVCDGLVAAVTLANAQGTKLGFNGPLGAYVFDKKNNLSIFEALAKNLKKESEMCYTIIPWYIMTTHRNDSETKEFFKKNNYFGYGQENIKFFSQKEIPMLDKNGKILLDQNGFIQMSANGHGDLASAMKENGILDELKRKKVEWVSVTGVNNFLTQPVDTVFIGMAVQRNVPAATKTIERHPGENLNMVCKKNGKYSVIEYSKLPSNLVEALDSDGRLIFDQGYASFNLFKTEALEKILKLDLSYHVMEDRGFQFKKFLADYFPLLSSVLVLQTRREEEYAAVISTLEKEL